jgi:sugar phosphate isomerase/epimerase
VNNSKIALQLYTLRELTGRDMLGTLREVGKIGYRAVEFAGFAGTPVEDIRTELDRLGMQAVSMHIGPDDLEMRPEQTLGDARILGCKYLVVAYIPEDQRRTAEQVRQLVQSFNPYGEICHGAGLRFAYHNHDFEFARLDGSTMFDILIEETDPALVEIELDVYWTKYANVDPISTLRRLSGRVPLLHAKDMAADEKRSDVPPGEGILPWSDILQAAAGAGVQWYIVEMDHPRDPLLDVELGLRNLARMLGE